MGGLLSWFQGETESGSHTARASYSPPQKEHITHSHLIGEADSRRGLIEVRQPRIYDDLFSHESYSATAKNYSVQKPDLYNSGYQNVQPTQTSNYVSEIYADVPSGCKTLSPSEIGYTQQTIRPTFYEHGRHEGVKIGQTLDDLLTNRIQIKDIPRITVCWYKQRWLSLDNRRLWVLKMYEKIQGGVQIIVNVTKSMDEEKFTTTNNGNTAFVRGDPGGIYWKKFK